MSAAVDASPVDAEEPRRRESRALDAALAYAAAGHPVLPLAAGTKIPVCELVPHGLKDATTDPETLRRWWESHPDAGVAIRCDGLIVIDVDPGGGAESLATLEQEHGPLPPTLEQATPRGGRHLLFRLPPGISIGNSTRGLGRPVGLDIRAGDRGYIAASPTTNGAGVYRWTNRQPIADAPRWLVARLTRPLRDRPLAAVSSAGEHSPYGRTALEAEVAEVGSAPEGQRNARLNEAAFALGQLEAGGELAPGEAEDMLVAGAMRAGLLEPEARRTARSGLGAGRSAPRSAPAPAGGNSAPPRSSDYGREPALEEALRDPDLHAEYVAPYATLVDDSDAATAGGSIGTNVAASSVIINPDPTGSLERVYEPTDLGNAAAFGALFGKGFRYVKERRTWLHWQHGRWRQDKLGAAERAAKEVARARLRQAAELEGETQKQAVRWALASQSAARVRDLLTLASTEPEIVLPADALDRDPFLLSVPNGVLDLRTATLRTPDPSDLISLGTDVPFDPAAACPRWELFLDEIFDGDAELITYVQRKVGYALTGDTREQIVTVCYGSGWNGKDTFFAPIRRILGPDLAQTTPFETFVRSRGDKGVRNDLARLHRARVVMAFESGEGRRLDEATVKLVSGGSPVPCRFLYGEYFEYLPEYKVFLVTNHKPRVEADDEAVWRRLRLVPFLVSFRGRADKTLDRQLEAELPGILAWAARGCLAWQQEGLGEAQAVTKATNEYRAEEDVLGAFLSERCSLEGMIEPERLRDAFETFCRELGEKPMPPNVLGKRLAKQGITRATRDGRSVYLGATLR